MFSLVSIAVVLAKHKLINLSSTIPPLQVVGLSEPVIRRLVGAFLAPTEPADVATLLADASLLPHRVEEVVEDVEEQYIV